MTDNSNYEPAPRHRCSCTDAANGYTLSPLVIHEFRDRSARMCELVDVWFDDEALAVPRNRVTKALMELQAAIERLEMPLHDGYPTQASRQRRL